jgi:hypothetical protein
VQHSGHDRALVELAARAHPPGLAQGRPAAGIVAQRPQRLRQSRRWSGARPAALSPPAALVHEHFFRLRQVSGYNVSGADRYAAICQADGGPAFRARHGLNSNDDQQTFDSLVAQGFRMANVSGYSVG